MAAMIEIRNRIKSVQGTMKITSAMYLISSSKLKKAKKNLADTEPYFLTLQKTIYDIFQASPELSHPFFDKREEIPEQEKKRAYIVITADKGLAGAYNHNVLKLADQEMQTGKNNTLFVVGQAGVNYYHDKKEMIDCAFLNVIQNVSMYHTRKIAEVVINLYKTRMLDEVYIVYSKMISAVKVEPCITRLLPLARGDFDESVLQYHSFTSFYPSEEKVLDRIIPNYIKGIIYGALVESFCSEQNSRMMAMDSATKSAAKMLKNLNLMYNRARQAAITQEITEIVSGAKALKKR